MSVLKLVDVVDYGADEVVVDGLGGAELCCGGTLRTTYYTTHLVGRHLEYRAKIHLRWSAPMMWLRTMDYVAQNPDAFGKFLRGEGDGARILTFPSR